MAAPTLPHVTTVSVVPILFALDGFVKLYSPEGHGSRMNLPDNFLEIVIVVSAMTTSASDRHFVVHRL